MLAERMPAGVIAISESGIHSHADVVRTESGGLSRISGGRASDEIRRPITSAAGVARPMMVKVCGITNLEDALAAADAGASALGFNFYPKSPRYLRPEAARSIASEVSGVLRVGVFVNESPVEVVRMMQLAGMDVAQIYAVPHCLPKSARGRRAMWMQTFGIPRPTERSNA